VRAHAGSVGDMGKPFFIAVPDEVDFAQFATLCARDFAPDTFEELQLAVDLEAQIQSRLGRRVICVPMHIHDFAEWLGERKASGDLWLSYASERAEGVREWPPVKTMYFPYTGDPSEP
jgi:hypothetical protein